MPKKSTIKNLHTKTLSKKAKDDKAAQSNKENTDACNQKINDILDRYEAMVPNDLYQSFELLDKAIQNVKIKHGRFKKLTSCTLNEEQKGRNRFDGLLDDLNVFNWRKSSDDSEEREYE